MSEFKKLYEWARPGFIKELTISRERDQGIALVNVLVASRNSTHRFSLSGLNDFDALPRILESERVVISRELNCQREFGSVQVECYDDDCYSEYWCDSYNEST